MELPYRPIDCTLHDRLLDWATLRTTVDAQLIVADQAFQIRDIIVDVFTQDHAEWIRFANGSQFRLDALVSVNGFNGNADGLHCKI